MIYHGKFFNFFSFSGSLMGQDNGNPSWKLSLPHVCVATITSFLFGYHIGFVLFIIPVRYRIHEVCGLNQCFLVELSMNR